MYSTINIGDKPMKILAYCANKFAGPQNRFLLGVSALASQPFIDFYNKNVDEKTRKYSVCKTVSKIIVGTTVGVLVRSLAIKYSALFLRMPSIQKMFPEIINSAEKSKILQSSIGDILGVITCLFTNFLIDAPLTKMGTNFLASKFIKEEQK